MAQETSAINDRTVYAQDTEPTDTRAGVLWVDTSGPTEQVKVYSPDASDFVSITGGETSIESGPKTGNWIETGSNIVNYPEGSYAERTVDINWDLLENNPRLSISGGKSDSSARNAKVVTENGNEYTIKSGTFSENWEFEVFYYSTQIPTYEKLDYLSVELTNGTGSGSTNGSIKSFIPERYIYPHRHNK